MDISALANPDTINAVIRALRLKADTCARNTALKTRYEIESMLNARTPKNTGELRSNKTIRVIVDGSDNSAVIRTTYFAPYAERVYKESFDSYTTPGTSDHWDVAEEDKIMELLKNEFVNQMKG